MAELLLIIYGKEGASALNTDGVSDEDFFRPVVVDRAWKFTSPTHYLLPIADSELNKNTLIVQNPGY